MLLFYIILYRWVLKHLYLLNDFFIPRALHTILWQLLVQKLIRMNVATRVSLLELGARAVSSTNVSTNILHTEDMLSPLFVSLFTAECKQCWLPHTVCRRHRTNGLTVNNDYCRQVNGPLATCVMITDSWMHRKRTKWLWISGRRGLF